ncbi:MAG TPA: GTP cyclohydrolase II [Acidobacteriota bacterium]|jgi:3,4-dihydroxy 2-butanone 4-phosphate synthase/GTP cyclohydrolase II
MALNKTRIPRSTLPTDTGTFTIYGFEDTTSGEEAVALVHGAVPFSGIPLVRIHSQCLTGDVFGSHRCDCGAQLRAALKEIASTPAGILLYQMQEGRGIGLINKLMAYELQDQGVDTVEANERLGFAADQRQYQFCAEILKYLGVHEIRLLTNNPAKKKGLEREGIAVPTMLPLKVDHSKRAESYMRAKREKLGHLL